MRSHIPFYRGTVIIITTSGSAVNKYRIVHSECVSVTLVTQDAMRMCPIILSSVAMPYFFTLSHKRQEFRGGGVIGHKMRVLIFPTTFV